MQLSNRHDNEKARRLGTYPALSHLDRRHLREIATWADEVVVPPGEIITGTGSPGGWVYLVADPTAAVMVGSGCRPAGEVIGVDHQDARHGVVAIDGLTIVAIPSRRRTALGRSVPALLATPTTTAPSTPSPQAATPTCVAA